MQAILARGATSPWRRALMIVTAAIALVALALTFTYPLNGDVQYVLGGLSVSEHPPWDVFVHRPLFYRLLMAPMSVLPEPAIRLAGIAFAGAGGWTILRSTARPAVAVGVAVALALSPAWFFLQPEWFAAGFAALAVGMRRRPTYAATFLVAATAVKLATLPVSLLGFLLIGLLDRDPRELRAIALRAMAIGAAWVGVMVALEWTWVRDMTSLHGGSVLNGGNLYLSGHALRVLVVAPVTLLGLLAIPSRNARLVLALVVALLLAAAPLFIQGIGTGYHLAAVPVLAAAIAAWRAPALLPVLVVLCAVTALPAWNWGTGRTNASWAAEAAELRTEATELSMAIGRDTRVTYLAYGTVNYDMRNPTACRYPSALWLVVGTDTESAAANRACLDSGGWIVVQPSWFGVVDCAERVTVGPLYACPPGSWTIADLPARP